MLLIPALAGAAELELGYRATEYVDTERVGHVGLEYGHKSFSLDAEYNYGEINGDTNMHDGLLSLNYSREMSDKWSLWLNESAGFDKPASIEFENRLGIGPKYTVYETDRAKLSVSAGILSHYQRLEADNRSTERWSGRVKARYKGLQAVYFYQPSVRDQSDYIEKGTLSIETELAGPLSVRYVLDSEYRSVEAQGKVLQSLNLVYKFGRN
jgi:hypothetical protein